MPEEETGSVTATLPSGVLDWLDRRADAQDLDREEFLRRLLLAQRAAEEGAADVDPAAATEQEVAALREELDEQVADLRERVVQVKRDADRKAAADHDHADLTARVDDVETAASTLRDRVADLDERLDAGFENYEEVLSHLTDAVDDHEERTETLARALLRTRADLHEATERREETAAVDELAREANRRGVRRADCEDCGGEVDVALLRRPTCPHCGAALEGVDPSPGFFGSDRLRTADRPALVEGEGESESESEGDGDDDRSERLAPIFESEGEGTARETPAEER